MPAKAGTHDKFMTDRKLAVGPGMRRDDARLRIAMPYAKPGYAAAATLRTAASARSTSSGVFISPAARRA